MLRTSRARLGLKSPRRAEDLIYMEWRSGCFWAMGAWAYGSGLLFLNVCVCTCLSVLCDVGRMGWESMGWDGIVRDGMGWEGEEREGSVL